MSINEFTDYFIIPAGWVVLIYICYRKFSRYILIQKDGILTEGTIQGYNYDVDGDGYKWYHPLVEYRDYNGILRFRIFKELSAGKVKNVGGKLPIIVSKADPDKAIVGNGKTLRYLLVELGFYTLVWTIISLGFLFGEVKQ